jgi:hypothetical protein
MKTRTIIITTYRLRYLGGFKFDEGSHHQKSLHRLMINAKKFAEVVVPINETVVIGPPNSNDHDEDDDAVWRPDQVKSENDNHPDKRKKVKHQYFSLPIKTREFAVHLVHRFD